MEPRKILINGRPVGQTPVSRPGAAPARPAPRKPYRFPEAIQAAAAALEVLEHHFPGHPWLHQARDGIELVVQRCIEQLAGTPPPVNGTAISSGGDYRAFARSAAEIKETMAAEEAAVSAARTVPRYRDRPDEVSIPESELADPMKSGGIYTPAPQQPSSPPPKQGWSM